MIPATDLEWGFKRPEIQAEALWGARAILAHGKRPGSLLLDILWDRQSLVGDGDTTAKAVLCMALNNGALNQLRHAVAHAHINIEEGFEGKITMAHRPIGNGKFFAPVVFYYKSRAGYLYITAHLMR